MTVDRIEEQIEQLQHPVDRLWWFAQLERGIELSATDREPRYGSSKVLRLLAEKYQPETRSYYGRNTVTVYTL